MDTVIFCRTSIIVFSIIIVFGAIMGFRKAKSQASLITGIISAVAFGCCDVLSIIHPLPAFKLAFVLIGALDGIFLMRLIKTKKFMPSGMLLILCAIEQIILYLTMTH